MYQFDKPIHLIGVGCFGSRAARELAEKGESGVRELHAWDPQEVEIENVGAQTYREEQLGMMKVDALAELVREWGGRDLVRHAEAIDGPRDLSGVVLVGVDKMSIRKQLWIENIKKNDKISLMIEIRLEQDGSYIHVLDPNIDEHVRQWERYWYPDDEATTAGMSCGAATALGPIASLTASLSVWQLVRWALKDRLDNQIRVRMRPLEIETYQW